MVVYSGIKIKNNMSLRDKYTDEEWSEVEKRSKEFFEKRKQEEHDRMFGKKVMKAILKSGIKMKVLDILPDGRYKLLDGDIVARNEIREIIEE